MTAFVLNNGHVSWHWRTTRKDHMCETSMEEVDDNQFTLRESKRRVLPSDFTFKDLPEQRHTHVFVR